MVKPTGDTADVLLSWYWFYIFFVCLAYFDLTASFFNINLTDWQQHVPNCRSLRPRLGQHFAENLPHPDARRPEEKPVDLQSKVHSLLACISH